MVTQVLEHNIRPYCVVQLITFYGTITWQTQVQPE